MKNLLLTSLFSLLAPAFVFNANAGAAEETEAVVIKVPSNGLGIEVAPLRFDESHLWTDTINFGSDGCNYGSPRRIARWRGSDLLMGYDYNYLEHLVWHNGKVILASPSLLVDGVDSIPNTVTFRYGTRTETIDFNRDDAINRLTVFVAPPRGWKQQAYTYSFDIGNDEHKIPLDKRYIISAPEDAAGEAWFVKLLIDTELDAQKVALDTVYVTDRPIENVLGYIECQAEEHIYYPVYSCVPAPANRKSRPLEGLNSTFEIFVDYLDNDIITIGRTGNYTYFTGGCRSSETGYQSFWRANGKEIEFNDVFNESSRDAILDIVYKYLAKSLFDNYELGEWEEDGVDVRMRPYNIEELLENYDPQYPEASDTLIVDRIAVSDAGVSFFYDLSCFSDFGEDPIVSFFVPWDDLRSHLRPGIPFAKK